MNKKIYKFRAVLIITLANLLICSSIFGQSPNKMSYQSVIRDNNQLLLANQPIGMQISILQGSASGTAVYVETHSATTNANGLVSIEIGEGTTSDDFTAIDWANGPYFIKTETDPTQAGGTNYTITGVSQLLSVPYALHAKTADTLTGGITETDPVFAVWDKSTGILITESQISDLGTYIENETDPVFAASPSSGITAPDITNWNTAHGWGNHATAGYLTSANYQTLSISGDNLSISDGNTVTIPSGGSIWLKDGNDVYSNDMNYGQSKLYFHPNGNMSYNSSWGAGAKFHLYEDNPSDTTIGIDVHSLGGRAINGSSTAKSNNNWMNVGVNGHVHTESGTSGRGVNGSIIGVGNGGYAVRGEAQTDNGWNTGVSGVALSRDGNNSWQIGGEFEARGYWDPANGVGTGFHLGATAGAYGGGTWNYGLEAIAQGSNPNSNNYGGVFWGRSSVPTDGFHYGIRAQADSSDYVNRGVVALTNGKGEDNMGGLFHATGTGHPTLNTFNTGVHGRAQNNRQQNIGVRGIALSDGHVNEALAIGVLGQGGGRKYMNYGVYGMGWSDDNKEGNVTGVYGEVWGANGSNGVNFGVDGTVHTTGKMNIGVGGFSHGEAKGDSINIGLFGNVAHADTNYAVYATAMGGSLGYGMVNYGIYAEADSGTVANHAGFFEGDVTVTGNLNVTGNIAKGGGTFKIDHPLDPGNKYLVHSFVESPEMMNVYSGNITTDAHGFATVNLPAYFEAVNKDFRYQLTCIGTFAQAIIKEEISNNSFIVQTNEPHVKVSWQVTAVRNDNYAQQNRIEPEQMKPENERGRYLHPELYGKSRNQRVNPPKRNVSIEMLEMKNDPKNRIQRIHEPVMDEPAPEREEIHETESLY